MNTYRKQSRTPKQQPASQCIDRLKRQLEALGLEVTVEHGTGRYQPLVAISVWPKRDEEAA